MTEDPLRNDRVEEDAPPKPGFPEEYREWLWDRFQVSVGAEARSGYEQVSQQLLRQFGSSEYWRAVPHRLRALNATYKVEKGVPLLVAPNSVPELKVKTWDAFLGKSYRRNVSANPRWPEKPAGDWALPPAWFEQVGDIVRTFVVVKYLDGMTRVAEELVSLASEFHLTTKQGRLAKVEGYYATHVDVSHPIEVPAGLDTETIDTRVEIQVTTELQENIRDLAHRQYETRRMSAPDEDLGAWQWNYRSEEFSANYLGHVLHYLEGMIMQLREGFGDRNTD